VSIIIFNPQDRDIDSYTKSLLTDYQDRLDLVACIGGDGTILGAEIKYPNIPKLPIKSSDICYHCPKINLSDTLKLIEENKIYPKEYIKIEYSINDQTILALNEINICHKNPTTAIRFSYDNENYIADGIIISTPFGSTGYFHSISQTSFREGIGITLNNATIGKKTIILPDSFEIIITLDRGPAIICSDNNPKIFDLKANQMISIKKSSETAKIFQ